MAHFLAPVDTNQQENVVQPFKFVGQYGVMAEDNGWYYMRARYYDPAVGRFISEDPLGFDGGDVNLYAYASNNPVMFIDPSGLIWETIDHDYHGKENWLRGSLTWLTRKIGSGWDPGIPGSHPSDYEGTNRDVVQIWLHDVDNPSRDSEYEIGTTRTVPQTFVKKPTPKPNELWDPTTTHYWKPAVSTRTYDNYPKSKIQSPGKRKY